MSAYYKSRIVYPNRKKEARKRAFGFAFLVLGICVLIGLLGWGIYSFIRLEKFRIKHIAVEGTMVLSQDEIRAFAERELDGLFFFIIPKNHYVFASSRRLTEALQAEFPRISTASVHKAFPDGIKIVVEERKEWGIYCVEISNQGGDAAATSTVLTGEDIRGNSCGYIDRGGVLFEYPLEISGAFLPVISDDSRSEIRAGERVVEDGTISFFETAKAVAQKELGVSLLQLGILKELPDDYRLYTNEGWYALVPRTGDMTVWLNPLKALLDHELKNRAGLEYIDARFGNKLFYKKK